jgi:OFA family oxalate/formate antiporter-like MFS transporter
MIMIAPMVPVAIALIFAQLSLGGVYAWSTYVPGLCAQNGLDLFQTQVVFGSVFAVFVASMLMVRRMLSRFAPRRAMLVAGLLYGAGHGLAWAGQGGFPLLLLGIAFVSAIGTGIGYGTALAVMTSWLPQRPGLATAIAVTGFGGGSLVQAVIAEVALEAGWSALSALASIGLVASGVIIAASLAVHMPDGSPSPVDTKPAEGRDLKTLVPQISHLWFAIFCATGSGLLVIGMLKPLLLQLHASPWAVAVGVSALAIGNLLGRIVWGAAFDAWRTRVPVAALCGLTVILLLLPVGVKANGLLAVGLVFLLGCCFGACFVIFAGMVSARWGPLSMTSVYPLVFTGYGFAGLVIPASAGLLMGYFSNPMAICGYAAALSALAAVLTWRWLRKNALALARPWHGGCGRSTQGLGKAPLVETRSPT